MFPNKLIEEQYKALGYFIDLAFPVHKLGLEVDGNGHMNRSEAEEKERQKNNRKKMVSQLLELIQTMKVSIYLLKLAECKITLLNQPKKITKKSTKTSIKDDVEKLLKAGSNFNHNSAVSKLVKQFVRYLLPTL